MVISDHKEALLKPSDGDEKGQFERKGNEKMLGVSLSFCSALLLLVTNSILKGMELDFSDAIFVQSLTQVITFGLLLCRKRSCFWVREVVTDKNITHVSCLLIFGTAMVGGMSRTTDVVAVTFMPLGDAMTIILSSAIPTTIIAAIFLKERLRLIKVVCLVLVVTGIILVIRPPFIFNNNLNTKLDVVDTGSNSTISLISEMSPLIHNKYYYIGAASAIGCMIFQSFARVGIRCLMKNQSTSSSDLILFNHGIACFVMSLLLSFAIKGKQRIINSSEGTATYDYKQWISLFGFAILIIIQLCMRVKALHLISPVIVGFVRSTEIVLSYIVQVAFFATVPKVSAIVGSCLVLVSCVSVLIEDSILDIVPKRLKNIL